jgi:hypothetical protein
MKRMIDTEKLIEWLKSEEDKHREDSYKCTGNKSTMLYGMHAGINWVKQNIWAGNFDTEEDEQCFDSMLRLEPDGQYWVLRRGDTGWVRLDRFVEEGDES